MFQRINPDELNGRQKEIYNFQKSAALLADYGFNCIKLTDDWLGADFLAHHCDGTTTLKVQLKARLTIDRKYTGHDLWMNFPCKGTWYLVPHDDLVELVGKTTNWLNTSSWREHGAYSSTNPSPTLLELLRPYNIEDRPEASGASALPAQTQNPHQETASTDHHRVRLLAAYQLGRSRTRSHRSRIFVLTTARRVAGQLPHRSNERRGYEHDSTLPRQATHPERPNRHKPVRGVPRP